MGLMSGLAGVFDPSGANSVASDANVIGQTLSPGSAYNQSGELGLASPGSLGSTIMGQAAQAGANVLAPHLGAMNNDEAQMGALSALYGGLFRDGGPAETAAVQQASADIAGSKAADIRATGRQAAANVTNVANDERGQNAAGETKMSANEAATKLQAYIYQASANHANHVNAIAAQNVRNGLLNSQSDLRQQLRQQGMNAQHTAQATALQNQQNVNQLGQTVLQAGLGVASQGAATGLQFLNNNIAQPYTTDASGNVGGIVSAMPQPGVESYGAAGYNTGYQTPVAQAPVVTSTPYSPTNTVYPTSASAPGDWLAGGVGLVG